MTKRLFFILFTFFFFSSFSQQIAVYDFENLSLGDITGQDGWEFSTSMSSMNNGYNCPVVGTPLIPQITNMPDDGDYQASKGIRSGDGWGNQHVFMSRVNNGNWSFPSFENRQYLILEFEMTGGCWGKMLRLAFDQNNDGNFGQNCGQADPNEASFGLSWFACGTPSFIRLYNASSEIVATENNTNGGWIKYLMVIDFYANNFEGNVNVYTKHLSNQGSWISVPSMQNINLGFDIESMGNNNPFNLNGIMLDHEAGSNSTFDNIEFTVTDFNHSDTIMCKDDTITIGTIINGCQYLWNTGDTTATIDVTSAGTYYVDLHKDGLKILTDTINVSIIDEETHSNIINDTTFCLNEPISLFADNNLDYHMWSDSTTNNQLIIDTPGTYSIYFSKNGCIFHDSIEVQGIAPPYLELGEDTILCPNTDFELIPYTNGEGFKWNNGSTQASLNVIESGRYFLTASIEQCTSTDTINVTIIPDIDLGNDTTICEGDFFTIDLDKDYDDYSWNDGDKKPTKDIHYNGEYSIKVKKNGCTINSDTLKVDRILLPRILETSNDTLICENAPLLLKVRATHYDGLLWHDSQTDTMTMVRHAGIYWINAINECGVISDSIKVESEDCLCEEYLPNVFTPNGDRLNDSFGYHSNCEPVKYYELKIFNRWEQLMFESRDYKERWDGTYAGRTCPTGVYSYLLIVQYKHDLGKRTIKRRISITL